MSAKKPKLRELVIDRNKWLRGVGGKNSALWRTDINAGCCLGHAARQFDRFSSASLADFQLPDDMEDAPKTASSLCEIETPLGDAATINDEPYLTDVLREKRLRDLFAQAEPPIKLRFTGPRKASLARIKKALGAHP